MAIFSVYREFRKAAGGKPPAVTRLGPEARRCLKALGETYGPELLGPTGVLGALETIAPTLTKALARAPRYGLEEIADRLMQTVAPLLPGEPPDLYLGTLLFIAPAATLNFEGKPGVVLGLERFHPSPSENDPKFWYRPDEAEEMIPHEAAHAARMQALGLPPAPRQLSLLDMVMLEGTALTFTDLLLGRRTLATFMPADRLAWHEAHDAEVRAAIAQESGATGVQPFRKYFGVDSPVSGYYAGYSLCREYLDRHGADSLRDLLALPSAEIMRRLSSAGPAPGAPPKSPTP